MSSAESTPTINEQFDLVAGMDRTAVYLRNQFNKFRITQSAWDGSQTENIPGVILLRQTEAE